MSTLVIKEREEKREENSHAIKSVFEYIKKHNIKMVDLKFNDLPGLWQHFSLPVVEFDESIFHEGIGFDGSSIRGFKKIHESDMILMPDPTSMVTDPVCEVPTLSLICDIYDPITKQPYTRDPRYIAEKAEKYLASTGIATKSYFGPEAEFFILDSVRFDQTENAGFYYIDSVEGQWNSGKDENPNLGYTVSKRDISRYLPMTAFRICGRKSCLKCLRSASLLKSIIMR